MGWDNQGDGDNGGRPQQGPWGGRPSGDRGSDHDRGGGGGNRGQRPGNDGGQQDAPDLDEMLRQAQDRLAGVFGSGGGGGGFNRGSQTPQFPADFKKTVGMGVLVALALWLATGLYRVQPEEHAVVLTFGKLTSVKAQPGLGYAIPWPVQQVQKVGVTFERRLAVGFRDAGAKESGDVASESLMLTGDENIIDIDFIVLWKVSDAGKFLFEIRDPEMTVKKVAESAMREIIGRTEIQKALTEARGQIETDTKALMQKILDEYQSGIAISNVQLQKVNPPAQVVDAFDDVQRARADKERLKNEADTYRNDILPRARGDAEKLIQEATGYKEAVIARATGDADRFTSVYKAYAGAKDVTERRIYLETMQEILANSKKVIIDGKGASGVLPYLPLGDALKTPPAKQ